MNSFTPGLQVALTRDLGPQFPAGLAGFVEMTSANPPLVCICFLCPQEGGCRTQRLLFAGPGSDALEARDTWPQAAVDRLLQELREGDKR